MGENSAWVVVPVFNEAPVLAAVLANLHEVFSNVICVDDGSVDSSADIARAAGAAVVRHPINLGQGAALQSGFDWVRTRTDADYVVTFDSDGQHDAADALSMLAKARLDRLDVVLGSRNLGQSAGVSRSRRVLLKSALAFSRITTGLQLSDTHNGLRVLSRDAINRIRLTQAGMAHASELESQVAHLGLAWAEAPVCITYTDYTRAKGQSNLNAVNIVFDLFTARFQAAS